MINADFLVVGAGVVGVCISRELKRRHPDLKVVVLEKEPAAGLHASGRNSGVLHAGFYYSPDGLKARFTRLGNAAMRATRSSGQAICSLTIAEADTTRPSVTAGSGGDRAATRPKG